MVVSIILGFMFYEFIKQSEGFQKNNRLIRLRGLSNKFPDFFRVGTFIDSTHGNL